MRCLSIEYAKVSKISRKLSDVFCTISFIEILDEPTKLGFKMRYFVFLSVCFISILLTTSETFSDIVSQIVTPNFLKEKFQRCR